jgi:hypothetical protein
MKLLEEARGGDRPLFVANSSTTTTPVDSPAGYSADHSQLHTTGLSTHSVHLDSIMSTPSMDEYLAPDFDPSTLKVSLIYRFRVEPSLI